VEVKKPGFKVFENPKVLGQICDHMRRLQIFLGINHPFGIVSMYEEWRVYWFEESAAFTKAIPTTGIEDGLKASIGAVPATVLEDESDASRKLYGSEVFGMKTDTIRDVLATVLYKTSLSLKTRTSPDLFSPKRVWKKLLENSFSWKRLPDPAFYSRNFDFEVKDRKKWAPLYLLQQAIFPPTAEGEVYTACNKEGSVCVVKLRKKSVTTKLVGDEAKHFSADRIGLAEQEETIWKSLYPELEKRVHLVLLIDREALIMPLATPVTFDVLKERKTEAERLLTRISNIRLTSTRKAGTLSLVEECFTKGSAGGGGNVEHADLKFSHFGIFKLIFDFGIVEFHNTQQAALGAMMESFNKVLKSEYAN